MFTLKNLLSTIFSAFAMVCLLNISSCNSGSKDTIPTEVESGSIPAKNNVNTTMDSATNVPKIKSETTTTTAETEAPSKAETVVVTIENMKFNPATITVKKGDKVTFINKDIVAHNATETKKLWASPLLQNGESWTFSPEKTTDYYCTVHVVMKGKIIVK